MIFAFWTDDLKSGGADIVTPPGVFAWRELYPALRLYNDNDIISLLAEMDESLPQLYRRIRIPACRSDVARLVLLYKFGGLYVDCHSGPGDTQRLADILEKIAIYEIIVIDKVWERESEYDVHLANSIMGARKGSDLIKGILDKVLVNLLQHEAKEHASGSYVPYNLAVLTGAWNLRLKLFEVVGPKVAIRRELVGRVCVLELQRDQDCGIVLYKYYSYRKPGRHWSERQNSEMLFLPRDMFG